MNTATQLLYTVCVCRSNLLYVSVHVAYVCAQGRIVTQPEYVSWEVGFGVSVVLGRIFMHL